MTDPPSADPGIADTETSIRDKPERSRAELLRLLRNAGYAASQRPHPTPRFLPDGSTPGPDDDPAWLHRRDEPVTVRDGAKRWRRKSAATAGRRRRACKSGRGLWLATTAMLGVAVIAGAGLVYIAVTGRDLPSAAQLALAGDAIAGLWPGAGAAGKTDPAGRVELTPAQETALAAPIGKPVVTAHLDVADASGEAMQPIPLHLGIAGAPDDRAMAIALYGLPDNARLSAGKRQPDGGWLIPAAATADVKVTLPASSESRFTLAAAVRDDKTGSLASPYKEFSLTVTGTSAAAKIAPASDVPSGSGAGVFTQGLEAMLAGDVKTARPLFRQAIELGEQRAIAHLGRSYDPLVLAHLKSSNAAANREKAIAWYKRAIEAGDKSVKPDMVALEAQQHKP